MSKESLITAITEPSRRLATQTARVLFPEFSIKNVSTCYASWRASVLCREDLKVSSSVLTL